jgi:hypothetical protein
MFLILQIRLTLSSSRLVLRLQIVSFRRSIPSSRTRPTGPSPTISCDRNGNPIPETLAPLEILLPFVDSTTHSAALESLTVAAADPPDDLVIYGEDVNSLRRGRAAPIAAATAYSGRLPRSLTPSAPRSTYVPSFPASVPPHMAVARRVCAATSEVGESKGQWHQHDKLIIFPQQRTSTCTASPSDGTSAGRPDASRGTAAREIL